MKLQQNCNSDINIYASFPIWLYYSSIFVEKADWLISISESFCVKDPFDFLLFIIHHVLATIHSVTGHSLELLSLPLKSFCVWVNLCHTFIFHPCTPHYTAKQSHTIYQAFQKVWREEDLHCKNVNVLEVNIRHHSLKKNLLATLTLWISQCPPFFLVVLLPPSSFLMSMLPYLQIVTNFLCSTLWSHKKNCSVPLSAPNLLTKVFFIKGECSSPIRNFRANFQLILELLSNRSERNNGYMKCEDKLNFLLRDNAN